MTDEANHSSPPTEAVTPHGMNHLVLNVYNMEETHRFWTEIIGMKLVGELKPGLGFGGQQKPKMQFYSGHDEGKRRHHDIAFVENPKLPPKPEGGWNMYNSPTSVNHIAIELPDRESWSKNLFIMSLCRGWWKLRGCSKSARRGILRLP